jgi:hypothetical protein
VRFGEVLIFTRDADRSRPEILFVIFIVLLQPHEDIVGFADVEPIAGAFGIRSHEYVHAGTLKLLALGHLMELGSRDDKYATGPINYLGHDGARGSTIHEVYSDRFPKRHRCAGNHRFGG